MAESYQNECNYMRINREAIKIMRRFYLRMSSTGNAKPWWG